MLFHIIFLLFLGILSIIMFIFFAKSITGVCKENIVIGIICILIVLILYVVGIRCFYNASCAAFFLMQNECPF